MRRENCAFAGRKPENECPDAGVAREAGALWKTEKNSGDRKAGREVFYGQ